MWTRHLVVIRGLLSLIVLIGIMSSTEGQYTEGYLVCRFDTIVSCQPLLDPSLVGVPSQVNLADTQWYHTDKIIDHTCQMSVNRLWIHGADTLCNQHITVKKNEAYDPTTIRWPAHYNSEPIIGYKKESCSEQFVVSEFDFASGGSYTSQDFGYVNLGDTPCSIMSWSYEDHIDYSSRTCGILTRQWTVIDWCALSTTHRVRNQDLYSYYSDECSGEKYARLRDVKKDGFYTYFQKINLHSDYGQIRIKDRTLHFTDFCLFAGECRATIYPPYPVNRENVDDIQWWACILGTDGIIKHEVRGTGHQVAFQTGVSPQKNEEYILKIMSFSPCMDTTVAWAEIIFDNDSELCGPPRLMTLRLDSLGQHHVYASELVTAELDNCTIYDYYFRDSSGTLVDYMVTDCESIGYDQVEVYKPTVYRSYNDEIMDSCQVFLMINAIESCVENEIPSTTSKNENLSKSNYSKARILSLQPKLEVVSAFPNPFQNQILIEIFIPADGAVEFAVYDMAGKVIYYDVSYQNKGTNQYILTSEEVPLSGVYHAKFFYSGRMTGHQFLKT